MWRLCKSVIKPRQTAISQLREIGVHPHGGSAWWILTAGTLAQIIEAVKTGNPAIDLFKRIITPEEMFFQTLVARSKNKHNISEGLTYANFAPPGRKPAFHPYVITIDDEQWVGRLPHYFARKFDENVDSSIFDRIDETLLKT